MRSIAVIANYNHGKYLVETMESVKAQTQNCDVAVYDDGSTDNSVAIIKDWINKNGGKLYIGQESGRGPSIGRNTIILDNLDNYDYFAILDADDIWHPQKVEKITSIMNDKVTCAYADYETFRENGVKIREFKEPFSRPRLLQDCMIHSGSIISASAIKSILNRDGYIFDPYLHPTEDYDLWIRLTKTEVFGHVPEILTYVRIHKDHSGSRTKQEKQMRDYQRIWEKENGEL